MDFSEAVKFEKKELTRDGFLELSKIEAQQEDLDLDNIRQRLTNMGFNQSLTNDHVRLRTCATFLVLNSVRLTFLAKVLPGRGHGLD